MIFVLFSTKIHRILLARCSHRFWRIDDKTALPQRKCVGTIGDSKFDILNHCPNTNGAKFLTLHLCGDKYRARRILNKYALDQSLHPVRGGHVLNAVSVKSFPHFVQSEKDKPNITNEFTHL